MKIYLYLVIKRHNENSTDGYQILHVVLMFRWTSCPTVQPIIQPAVWAEQQTIATSEDRLTELKLIK